MATPASGAITAADLRSEITRGGAGALSMSEVRTRYGGAGAISFGDLYAAEGWTVTVGSFSTKYTTQRGWSSAGSIYGSVSPAESGNQIGVAANSWIFACAGIGAGGVTTSIRHTNASVFTNGNLVTSGYKSTDVIRFVTANTSRSVTNQVSNTTWCAFESAYDFPANGTIVHCMIQF